MKTMNNRKEIKEKLNMEPVNKRIITGAMEVFADIGYKKATVKDIVSRANVSHGTFYNYFKNKPDLLNSMVNQLIRNIDSYTHPSNRTLNLYEKMRMEAIKILEYYITNRNVLIALKEAKMFDRKFEEGWLKISEGLFRRIERDISGAIDKGLFRKVKLDVTIRSITSMFEGYGYHLMMNDHNEKEVYEVADSLTKLCYKALFKD
ncbi:TetR/AcrR family transcriptional regulator [Bacillus sp. B15-48]|uniref:TetR/AcrR family transcriptional regulator n=1 Tax=Bacillus sp. B15-48 TaxID=1548601 RepID=UPI00193EEB94|nr:TetR/AcrR family transcriptional regulator [Bacillus sp. B15-48]MBM4763786.1 TetR family transcriptional regulator [Bacillus sp. B15-48]